MRKCAVAAARDESERVWGGKVTLTLTHTKHFLLSLARLYLYESGLNKVVGGVGGR